MTENPYILLHEQNADGCIVLRGVLDVREVAYAATDGERTLRITFRNNATPAQLVIHSPGGMTPEDLLDAIYKLKKALLEELEPASEAAPWWAPWRR